MADYYLLESGEPDGYLLEDGSGVLLLEDEAAGDTFIEGLHRIEMGMKPVTAAGIGGVLIE